MRRSGGDEPCTEAAAMRDYMISHGADAERLILEDKSSTTIQNIANAKKAAARGRSCCRNYKMIIILPVHAACWRMPVWATQAFPRKRRIRGSGWR